MYHSVTAMCMCAHFCYRVVHCGYGLVHCGICAKGQLNRVINILINSLNAWWCIYTLGYLLMINSCNGLSHVQCQAISWMESFGIHPRAISQEIIPISNNEIRSKIENPKLYLHLPGVNELCISHLLLQKHEEKKVWVSVSTVSSNLPVFD